MTIVLPNNYHAKPALEKRRVQCIEQGQALKEDIRSLRIGIMNIMPEAETYEYSLLFPLGRSVIQVEPIWIRLETHEYSSTNERHLNGLYLPFEEAIKDKHLDGLILTGAPVEEIPFEEIKYWEEIKEIMLYARENIASTLGICWGGLALAYMMGIERKIYKKKIFGMFEAKNIDSEHKITGCLDDIFWCPYSSFANIPDQILEMEQNRGNVNLLSYSGAAGYVIFESSDHRYLMHLGHPEYEATRFGSEYSRDKNDGKSGISLPENIDINNPVNRWRGHCLEFFTQWIKYVHETTPF